MIYIQRLGKSEKLKTIKEFDSESEAMPVLKELRKREDALYYLSNKACRSWKHRH